MHSTLLQQLTTPWFCISSGSVLFVNALHIDLPSMPSYISTLLFCSHPTQDFDTIAEANELYDAVLTGSVDRDKKGSTNAGSPNKTPTQEEANSTTEKCPDKGNPQRRLAIYIGNFPWVSNTLSVYFNHISIVLSNIVSVVLST